MKPDFRFLFIILTGFIFFPYSSIIYFFPTGAVTISSSGEGKPWQISYPDL